VAAALLESPETLLLNGATVIGKRFDPFAPTTAITKEAVDASATLDTLGSIGVDNAELLKLLACLRPYLLAIWLESAPNVFAVHGGIQHTPSLGAVHLVLRILRILWRATFGGTKPAQVSRN
jgi:hypothetical protein